MKENAAKGATREFVIRHGAETFTEAGIREHMEHIHNLFIISCDVVGDDIHIETNSMNNTFFAVNCMRSRKDYKGFRIETYPDRCNMPLSENAVLEETNIGRKGPQHPTQQHVTNKFGALSTDDDDPVEEDEDQDTSGDNSGVDLKPRSKASTIVD